jgi:hypothetical protein
MDREDGEALTREPAAVPNRGSLLRPPTRPAIWLFTPVEDVLPWHIVELRRA